jgi:hypothetical protein
MGEKFCKECQCDNNKNIITEKNLYENNKEENDETELINNSNINTTNILNTKIKFNFSHSKILTTNFSVKTNKNNNSSNKDIESYKILLNKILNLLIIKVIKNLLFSFYDKIIKNKNNIFIEYTTDTLPNLSNNNDNKNNVNLFPNKENIYIGSKLNDNRYGFGMQIFYNKLTHEKSLYFGLFFNNKRYKYCKFKNLTNKIEYNGEVNGKFAQGFGILKYNNINLNYTGYFNKNLRDGIGYEIYKDKSFYKGEFKNGKKNGIGKYIWTDGSIYEGEWEDNNLQGLGIYIFKDKSFYQGYWKNSQMEGFGEFCFPKIKSYFGYFKNDRKNGFGIVFWYSEKKMFVGFWDKNKQNGLGKLIKNNKEIIGRWKDGKKYKNYSNIQEIMNEITEIEKKYINIIKYNYEEIEAFINKYK